MASLKTPVLLIIFNRFDTTVQVLDALRKAQTPALYVYCDGPRQAKEGEAAILQEVQAKVLQSVDWPCEVHTQFRTENEGPRLAIGHAINWFFEHVEQGIILEHDCVPHPSFFSFCESLLEYYKDNEQVMHISGDNFQFGKWRGDGSYYFSRITHIWGFATWRRAWKHYDVHMSQYPAFKEKDRVREFIHHKRSQKFWRDIFERSYTGAIQSWDYQWTFSVWLQNGLAILPNKNLVSNVGFDGDALNTTDPNHKLASMKTEELNHIIHPSSMQIDEEADAESMDKVFYPSYFTYFMQKIGSWFE